MVQSSRLFQRLQAEQVNDTIHNLTELLRAPDSQVYLNATRKLINRGESAVDSLVDALGDDDEQVWQLAAAALVKIGDAAVPHLIAALEHPHENVRLLAAAILMKLGQPARSEPAWQTMQQGLRQHQQETTHQ